MTKLLDWLNREINHAEKTRKENYYPISDQTPDKLRVYNRATFTKKVLTQVKEIYEQERQDTQT